MKKQTFFNRKELESGFYERRVSTHKKIQKENVSVMRTEDVLGNSIKALKGYKVFESFDEVGS